MAEPKGMQITHHSIALDLDSLLREELPYLYGLYQHHAALRNNVQELLAFPQDRKSVV